MQARRGAGDRMELATDLGRRFGLGIEAIVLTKSARKKNEDHGTCGDVLLNPCKRSQRRQMVDTHPQEADCPCLNRHPPG